MRIDHFAMYVDDLEGARAFFMKYFGARSGGMYHNPRTGLRTYFLTFDGGARLEVMSRPGLAAAVGKRSARRLCPLGDRRRRQGGR